MLSTTFQQPAAHSQNTLLTHGIESLGLPVSGVCAPQQAPITTYVEDTLQAITHRRSKPAHFAALSARMRLPNMGTAQNIITMRQYIAAGWPYFFAKQHHARRKTIYDESHLVPVHLQHTQPPVDPAKHATNAHFQRPVGLTRRQASNRLNEPYTKHSSGSSDELSSARQQATKTSPDGRNPIAENRPARQDPITISYVDSSMQLVTPLNSWHENCSSNKAKKAAVSCLLKVEPPTKAWLHNDELLNLTVASACFRHAFLVRRDFTSALLLRQSIPRMQRRAALELARDYIEKHDIWRLKEYLSDESYFFDETTPLQDISFPAIWRNPRQWPGYIHATALWIYDLFFVDQADSES